MQCATIANPNGREMPDFGIRVFAIGTALGAFIHLGIPVGLLDFRAAYGLASSPLHENARSALDCGVEPPQSKALRAGTSQELSYLGM